MVYNESNTEVDIEEFPEIMPTAFFDLKIDALYLKGASLTVRHLLPYFEEMTRSEPFATISIGWNEEELVLLVNVDKPFESSVYPDYQKSDALEIFINTRGASAPRYPNRFCHHFVIFPTKVNGIHALELTKFRGEDRHDLCLPEQIEVKPTYHSKRYSLEIILSKTILNGYDPRENGLIGFDYRLHRYGGSPQTLFHTPSSVNDFSPLLWSKLELVN